MNKINNTKEIKSEVDKKSDSGIDIRAIKKQLELEQRLSDQLVESIEQMYDRNRDEIEVRGIGRKAISAWKVIRQSSATEQ